MLRKLLLSACAAAMLVVSAGVADAQTRSDRATYFTFSQPVAIPKVTLPAGKYLFRILDSPTTRSVVQVFDADGTKLYAMLLTIPAERTDPSDEAEVRFLETAANAPAAIATWWYPGMKTGWEFVYPKEQAMILARTAKQPVLSTTKENASVDDMKTADLVRVTPSGETPVSDSTRPAASTMSGRSQRGEVTQPAPRPTTPAPATAPATDPATNPARTRLPETFGLLPLIGVIGSIALVAGYAMRRRNGRSRSNMTPKPAAPASTTDYHRGV